jgi:hypothetical protein
MKQSVLSCGELLFPRHGWFGTTAYRPALVAVAAILCLLAAGVPAAGQTLIDSGFESYSVPTGQFLRPSSGPWQFGNDAAVVRPPAPHSSLGSLQTWSGMYIPLQGEQYVSTYGGFDTVRQLVTFSTPGEYRISVFAASPTGTVTIPPVGTQTLGHGEFTFTLGVSTIGDVHTVPAGTDWTRYHADFTIAAPGSFLLGVRNTRTAAYFINYDAFSLRVVPEPAVWALSLSAALGLAAWRLGKRRAQRRAVPSSASIA